MRWAIALLLLVVAFESFLLYQQRAAAREVQAQSAKLLTAFLQRDTTQASGAPGVPIRLQNVRFKWSDKVYIDAGNMAVRAVPLEGRTSQFGNFRMLDTDVLIL